MTGGLRAVKFSDVVRRVAKTTAAGGEPGFVAALYVGGQLQDSYSSGESCLEHGVRISPQTVFDIASCSKQFTASAAIVLSQDGVLDLDADVRELVPELSLPGVTLRNCLTHTSGLNDYMTLTELAGRTLGDMVDERDFLQCVERMSESCFAPGTDISYSNTGYVLAAVVLSRAAKQPFSRIMSERIFAPMGMFGTRLHDHVGTVVADLAFSYSLDGDRFAREEMVECQVGDGAVLTSVEELAEWQGFLLDGRGLGDRVRQELLQRTVLASGAICDYALGIQHRFVKGVPAYGHGGAMYGYRAGIVCLPSLELGVCVLSNRADLPVQAMTRSITEELVSASAPASTKPSAAGWTLPKLPAGDWISSAGPPLLRLGVEDERVTLVAHEIVLQAAGDRWRDDDGEYELLVEDGLVSLVDRMGRTSWLTKPEQSRPIPSDICGDYRVPDLGLDVRIERAGETVDQIVLQIPGADARALEEGQVAGDVTHYPLPGGGVLTQRAGSDDALLLTIWDVTVRLERVGGVRGAA